MVEEVISENLENKSKSDEISKPDGENVDGGVKVLTLEGNN